MSPYPTFKIDVPKDYWTIRTENEDIYLKETLLKADTFLSCLNSLVKIHEPKERDIFFAPFHDEDITNDTDSTFGKRFVSTISKILDSYPHLTTIIYPAKHIIMHLNIGDARFDCWSFIDVTIDCMTTLERLLRKAFGVERKHFVNDWKEVCVRPLTEGSHLGCQDCRTYIALVDKNNGLKRKHNRIQWDPSKKTDQSCSEKNQNHLYIVKGLFGTQHIITPVLLLAPFTQFGKMSDALVHLASMKKKARAELIDTFNKKLCQIGLVMVNDLMQHKSLLGVLNPEEDVVGDNNWLTGYWVGETVNDIGSDCIDIKGMLPSFLKEGMVTSTLEGNHFVDTILLQLASRAVYQYNKKKVPSQLIPLYINDLEYYGFHITAEGKKPNLIKGISANFRIQLGTPLGIYLPDDNQQHTVCAKIILKKLKNTKSKTLKYIFEVTVYDSLCDTINKKVKGFDCIEEKKKGNQEETLGKYDNKKKAKRYEMIIRRCIVPELAKRVVRDIKKSTDKEGDKLNYVPIKSISKKIEYTYTNSVLVQNNVGDNTCGINGFLCLLMLMKGMDPLKGLCGIKKCFASTHEYHVNMISLIYSIVIQYTNDHKFKESSVQNRDDNESKTLLPDSDDYKAMVKNIASIMKKHGTDFSMMLGADLANLLSFLPSETVKGNCLNDGKYVTRLNTHFSTSKYHSRIYFKSKLSYSY